MATRKLRLKQLDLNVFLCSTYSMQLAGITIAAITMCGSKLIQDWQAHNFLVNVAENIISFV